MEIIALHSKERKKGDEVSFLLVERLDRKWPINNCSINCWRKILSTNSLRCNFHAFLQNFSFTSRVFQLISLLFLTRRIKSNSNLFRIYISSSPTRSWKDVWVKPSWTVQGMSFTFFYIQQILKFWTRLFFSHERTWRKISLIEI